MKKYLLRLAAIAALIGFTSPAFAQGASDSSSATVDVVTAMTLTNQRDLAFGDVVSPTSGSCTVVLSAAETTANSGTCTDVSNSTSAQFDVTGDASTNYTITLPTEAINLSGTGTDIPVSAFADSETGTGTLDGTGADTFYVGATATIGNNQLAGSYTGTFNVSVDYE